MVKSSNIDFIKNESSEVISLETQDNGNFHLPEGFSVGEVELSQESQDLILTFAEGDSFSVSNYFSQNDTPLIQDANGGALNKALVDSFLTSSPEYAQMDSMSDESPVGAVEEIQGNAKVIRVNGDSEDLTLGSPIYEGDVIETSADGALNIMFIDETSLAVSEGARVAVDEYSFDVATESGVTDLSVLKGVFVYTSGLIGRDDPDDVNIDTPVGSIGIRGTVIAGKISPDGTSEISVLEGAIVVSNGTGETTLSQQYETVTLKGFESSIEYKGVEAAENIGKTYGSVSDVLPNLFSSINDNIQQETKTQESQEDQSQDVDVEPEIDLRDDTVEEPIADDTANDVVDTDLQLTDDLSVTNNDPLAQEIKDSDNNQAQKHGRNKERSNNSNKSETDFDPEFSSENQQNEDGSVTPPITSTPTFTPEFFHLFESSKEGTVVGTVTVDNFQSGIPIYTDSDGFSIEHIVGTNKFNIILDEYLIKTVNEKLNINIFTIQDGNQLNIANENLTVLDAVVNLGEPGSYGYYVQSINNAPPEEHLLNAQDFNGDGDDDYIAIIASNEEVGIFDNADLDNNIFTTPNPATDDVNWTDAVFFGDINNDGYADIVGLTTNNSGYGLVLGGETPADVNVEHIDLANTPSINATSIAGIGDFDGDGKSDFIIGAEDDVDASNGGNIAPGAVYIVTDNNTATSHIEGVPNNLANDDINFGRSMSGIGDFNGDGLSDVLVESTEGATVIYGGSNLGPELNQTGLGDRGFKVEVNNLITAAATGDINGDGFDDFAVSVQEGTSINTYVVYGSNSLNLTNGNFHLNNGDWETNIENPDNALKINHNNVSGNYQITALGDKNGDGFDDIQVGSGSNQYIVHGKAGGSAHVIVTDNSTRDANFSDDSTIQADDNYVSLVGDVGTFNDGEKTGVRMSGGKGRNVFEINNDDFARIDGGQRVNESGVEQIDTIRLTNEDANLDFSNFKFEKIQGIEEIEFGATGQTLVLTAENIFNLLKTSDNGALRITGPGTVKIKADTATNVTGALNELGEGAAIGSGGGGQATIDSENYWHYEIGGYDLYIGTNGTVSEVI